MNEIILWRATSQGPVSSLLKVLWAEDIYLRKMSLADTIIFSQIPRLKGTLVTQHIRSPSHLNVVFCVFLFLIQNYMYSPDFQNLRYYHKSSFSCVKLYQVSQVSSPVPCA